MNLRSFHRYFVGLCCLFWLAGCPGNKPAEVCNDGFDNDGDGLTDCQDLACKDDSVCLGIEFICSDAVDNDGDGAVDCDDDDCAQAPACNLSEVCDNGVDDDQDGTVDCQDSDCSFNPVCA